MQGEAPPSACTGAASETADPCPALTPSGPRSFSTEVSCAHPAPSCTTGLAGQHLLPEPLPVLPAHPPSVSHHASTCCLTKSCAQTSLRGGSSRRAGGTLRLRQRGRGSPGQSRKNFPNTAPGAQQASHQGQRHVTSSQTRTQP